MDYDLIVGADGVNSIVRRLKEKAFGTQSYTLTNHFAWYGVGRAMRPGSLVFRATPKGTSSATIIPTLRHEHLRRRMRCDHWKAAGSAI